MSLIVQIAAEFTGEKAFKKADTATEKLSKGVKKLGATLGLALSAQSIANFGKASVQAFIEDEKAAARLAKVVDNLGLGFANVEISGFIDDLTKATGVADGKLRPAFQALLTTTGSLINSQKLLKNAIDISAGSGVDLTTVAQDLANAYVGNTKGLKKYNLGLTNAQLKTASFDEVMSQLNENFGGANAAVLDTYSGKMEYLKNRASEAQEVIGKGLIDAITLAAGSGGDVESIGNTFDSWAKGISDAAVGIGVIINKLRELNNNKGSLLSPLGNWLMEHGGKGAAVILGQKENQVKSTGFSFFGSPYDDYQKKKAAEKEAKTQKEANKNSQALLKQQKSNTDQLKRQAAVKKQQGLFDLQQIQLVAALKGKLTEDERDKIKLQLALLQGNDAEATKLSQKIANSIDATGKLAAYLKTLPDAKNPFAGWKGYLDAVELQAKRVAEFSAAGTAGAVPKVPDTTGGAGTKQPDVTVNITALGQITTQQDITEAIRNGLLDAGMSGLAVANVRRLGSFGG